MDNFLLFLKNNYITFSVLSFFIILYTYMIHGFLKSGKDKFLRLEFLFTVFFLIAFTFIFILNKELFNIICNFAVFSVEHFIPIFFSTTNLMMHKEIILIFFLDSLWYFYFRYITSIYTISNVLLFSNKYSKLIFIGKLILNHYFILYFYVF